MMHSKALHSDFVKKRYEYFVMYYQFMNDPRGNRIRRRGFETRFNPRWSDATKLREAEEMYWYMEKCRLHERRAEHPWRDVSDETIDHPFNKRSPAPRPIQERLVAPSVVEPRSQKIDWKKYYAEQEAYEKTMRECLRVRRKPKPVPKTETKTNWWSGLIRWARR